MNFGSLAINSGFTAPVQVVFTNTSNQRVDFPTPPSGIDCAGECGEFGLLANNCGALVGLDIGDSCSIFVEFGPGSVGRHKAFFMLDDAAVNPVGKVTLIGQGT